MKKINMGLIKDLIISILIVICIALVISVFSYDKIALSKVIPEVEEYNLSEEMEEDLNSTYTEDSKEIITTYYIDAADLKKYEKSNEYNKGKQNPFAVESEEATSNEITTENTVDTDGTSSSTNSTKFYEDEGIK